MSIGSIHKSTVSIVEVETVWQEIENRLSAEKQRIFDEILSYPPPIPACDAQFNFLLEERSRITEELRRMRVVMANEANRGQSVRDFIESCRYFNNALAAKLLADLEKVTDERNSS